MALYTLVSYHCSRCCCCCCSCCYDVRNPNWGWGGGEVGVFCNTPRCGGERGTEPLPRPAGRRRQRARPEPEPEPEFFPEELRKKTESFSPSWRRTLFFFFLISFSFYFILFYFILFYFYISNMGLTKLNAGSQHRGVYYNSAIYPIVFFK